MCPNSLVILSVAMVCRVTLMGSSLHILLRCRHHFCLTSNELPGRLTHTDFPESKAPGDWSTRISLTFTWTNGSQFFSAIVGLDRHRSVECSSLREDMQLWCSEPLTRRQMIPKPITLRRCARTSLCLRKTQEVGLRGDNLGAFLKAGPIFQRPCSLP